MKSKKYTKGFQDGSRYAIRELLNDMDKLFYESIHIDYPLYAVTVRAKWDQRSKLGTEELPL